MKRYTVLFCGEAEFACNEANIGRKVREVLEELAKELDKRKLNVTELRWSEITPKN